MVDFDRTGSKYLLIYDLRACIWLFIYVYWVQRGITYCCFLEEVFTLACCVSVSFTGLLNNDGPNKKLTSEIKWLIAPWRYNVLEHFFLQKAWKYHDLGSPLELGSQNIFYRVIVQGYTSNITRKTIYFKGNLEI